MEDPRKTGLKNGLKQLTVGQLSRVLSKIRRKESMVLDSYNYEDGKFCPLAVALKLDETMEEPTHEKVFETLSQMGYEVYNTRGIQGTFYTTNREADLEEAAMEVYMEKIAENLAQGKCPCLARRDHCSVCDKGFHIFCNAYPHGEEEEAYRWFVENPQVTQQIKPIGPSPAYERAMTDIKKREIK